jgi:hypothetical protein
MVGKLHQTETTMSQQITNEQEFDLTIAFETEAGNPAVVVGIPVWITYGVHVATVNVRPDGRSAVVTSGLPGTATITVTAQTASGGTIVGVFDVTVVLADAGHIVFTVSNIRIKNTGTGSLAVPAEGAGSNVWMAKSSIQHLA